MLKPISILFTLIILLTASIANAQQAGNAQADKPEKKAAHPATMGKGKLTKAQKIALAESAGPASISKHAAIFDMTMPDISTQPKQLREGSNGWACYASTTEPMCLDKNWQQWVQALMSKTEPKIDGTGIAYMLRGDKGASNTDPYATKPTADNQWVVTPAHIMLIFPDASALDAYPTDPKSGGPWVMWKGTPYAHVMVPVTHATSATMPSK